MEKADMEELKIYYVDFWKSFEPEKCIFTKVLEKKYHVVLDEKDPDFVFCGTSGSDYLKYQCPRISFIGEARCPDFNIYDYAIGSDYLDFEDRYLHFPLCMFDRELLQKVLTKHTQSDEFYLRKSKFCNYVVSAGGGFRDQRDAVFDAVSTYKKVDSGGKYRNNLEDGKPVDDKYKFQLDYRFSLALENASMRGYTTEKIMDAWAAGTIPIYWGNPYIVRECNPRAFINVSDYGTTEELIRRIREIDENRELYLAMQKEPVFTSESTLWEHVTDDALERFLFHIVGQARQDAYRRSSELSMYGMFYEYRIKRWDRIEHHALYRTLQEAKRKIFGLKKIK